MTIDEAVGILLSRGFTVEQYRQEFEKASRDSNSPMYAMNRAGNAVHEMLKDYFWTDGGFLQSVALGAHEGHDAIFVYMTRRPRTRHEIDAIPESMNGFRVIQKVIGMVRPCGSEEDGQ